MLLGVDPASSGIGWLPSPGSCRDHVSRPFQASAASIVRVAASAAAAVGDSVNAAVAAFTKPNRTSVPSGPRRTDLGVPEAFLKEPILYQATKWR